MASADNVVNDSFLSANKGMVSKLLLALGIAITIALMSGFWIWSQKPDYKVLFSSFTDKDGGAIVAALEQMNVPYRFTEGGTALMVPADQVHQVRLKIASMGLPKGGNVGFELLENQKFGVSQFVEQVNFQRGLEGELEKSIQVIDAVENARVHLAIPKNTVFVREKEKPTASVILNLRAGRSLDEKQVQAIVHLVASSVPDLPVSNVSVIDQVGHLLSEAGVKNSKTLDSNQLKYVEDIQRSIINRVESIIGPLVGAENVHAQATAEIDFSTIEQADETYKPNQKPDIATVRSMQSSEMSSATPGGSASGVPGALTNQPQAPVSAPITTPPSAGGLTVSNASSPSNSEKNTTTNYEVDKSVKYSEQSMGGIKRLTVAVIINNKEVVDKSGKKIIVPLTEAEKLQITDIAKDAMGFKKDRGDSISVVNSSFVTAKPEVINETPVWKDPQNISMALNGLKMLFGVIVLFLIYKKALKPLVNKLIHNDNKSTKKTASEEEDVSVSLSGEGSAGKQKKVATSSYQGNLDAAKKLAKENPKLVAGLVTTWVSGDD